METCGICRVTDETVLDGLCEPCDAKWLNELSRVVPTASDETPLRELFGQVSASLLLKHNELSKLFQEGEKGTVPVYKYAFGQDIRYLLLGEFEIDGAYRTVVCTLESGKGNMCRTGLHWIVVHNESFLTEDTLQRTDAVDIVRASTSSFREDMKKTPIWMNVDLAPEMCRLGDRFVEFHS